MKKFTLFLSAMLFSVMSFAAVITFTPGEFDALESSQFDVVKGGVTLSCSSGTITADQFRFFKSQTLTVSSTAGNITSIEFTCTAANETKHGPGGFGELDGYSYADKVGTWTGNAASVTFSTTNNQVRATQVVVTIDGEGGGDTPDTPVTGTEITGLKEADAVYQADAEYGDYWVFDLFAGYDYDADDYIYPELYVLVNEAYGKTTLNGTYNVLYSEYFPNATSEGIYTDEYADDFVGSLTIKNVDDNGNYSFKGSFTTIDGTIYTFDQVVNVAAYEYIYNESTDEGYFNDLILSENGDTPDNPDTPDTPDTPTDGIVFDADVDKGNASDDFNSAAEFEVTKNGVTIAVSQGIIGTYNNECHYRVYKNQTLTVTSTAGNIVSVEFTCTANDEEKYGPGCFTVDGGEYTYSGAVGTWTGDAATVTFTASSNQVRTTQIVVTLAGGATYVENVIVGEQAEKVMKDGQLLIIRGEKMYNVLGAQVK